MRSLAVVLLIGCGGQAVAPVTISLEDQSGGAATISVQLERRLHPDCTANCELGPALPDGGDVFPLVERRDGGSASWAPVEVYVGTVVTVRVTPTGPSAGLAPAHCMASRRVTDEGASFAATVFIEAGTIYRDCSFEAR